MLIKVRGRKIERVQELLIKCCLSKKFVAAAAKEMTKTQRMRLNKREREREKELV